MMKSLILNTYAAVQFTNQMVKTFSYGGFAFLIWIISLFPISGMSLFGTRLHFIMVGLYSILAVLVYQPHFIAAMHIDRFNGKSALSMLSTLALLLFGFSGLLFLDYFLNIKIRNFFFTFVLFWAIYHFTMQTYGLVQNEFKSNNPKLKFQLKCVLLFQAYVGLFLVFSQKGPVQFFELTSVEMRLPYTFMRVLFWIALILSLVTILRFYKEHRSFFGHLLLATHVLIWTSDFFLLKYFYILPLVHSLQYMPHFWQKLGQLEESDSIKYIHVGLIITTSLICITYLPNLLDSLLPITFSGHAFSYVTITTLTINIFHFSQELRFFRAENQ